MTSAAPQGKKKRRKKSLIGPDHGETLEEGHALSHLHSAEASRDSAGPTFVVG